MIHGSPRTPDTMPPKPAKKPAAKKAVRRPPAKRKPSVPTLAVEVITAGRQGTLAQRQAFASLVATGTSLRAAYLAVRPDVEPCTADDQGKRWAVEMAEEIARLRQTASHAAALAHGVTQAYLVGHVKAMFETPIGQITPDSIYCKKHKVTTTSTDAGPKTTVEVEKDSPLAIAMALAKLTGHAEPPPLAEKAEGQDAEQEAERRVLGRVLARIVTAGSPIQRRVAEKSEKQI